MELRTEELKPGSGQLQTERVLPVDAAADGVGGLAIAEVLEGLHLGHRGQEPGDSPGWPRLGKRASAATKSSTATRSTWPT